MARPPVDEVTLSQTMGQRDPLSISWPGGSKKAPWQAAFFKWGTGVFLAAAFDDIILLFSAVLT
jgi:hypothetical protein